MIFIKSSSHFFLGNWDIILKKNLSCKEDASPVFCKPRPVPFALKEKVEKEIDRLIGEGVLVENSEWANAHCISSKIGQIRLCGDYKVTLNPHLLVDKHPIPRVSESVYSQN